MIVKIHKTHDGRRVIAVADDDLIGKVFEEGKKQLNLDSIFYKGEEIDEKELKKHLSQPCSVNIVGKDSIKFFCNMKMLDKDRVMEIKKIPYAQVIISAE